MRHRVTDLGVTSAVELLKESVEIDVPHVDSGFDATNYRHGGRCARKFSVNISTVGFPLLYIFIEIHKLNRDQRNAE